jgi:hypothetical protein
MEKFQNHRAIDEGTIIWTQESRYLNSGIQVFELSAFKIECLLGCYLFLLNKLKHSFKISIFVLHLPFDCEEKNTTETLISAILLWFNVH